MRFPLVQVNVGGEVLACFRLWHYVLYGVFEYYTAYYPETFFP